MNQVFELMVDLLRPEPRLLSANPPWDEIIEYARSSRLLLPLAEKLQHPALIDLVPSTVQEALSAEAAQRTMVEVHRGRRLLDLMDLLGRNGIEAKSFKGPTLAAMAHGRATLRECGDLDILVRRHDFEKALSLLQEEGFIYEMARQPNCYTLFHYGVPLFHGRSRLTVDLHYDLFSSAYDFPLTPYWQGDYRVRVQDREVPTFPPEETFVYLCLHGTKHCWSALRWLYDVKALSRKVDLSRLQNLAREQGCSRSVRLAFWLLEEVWQQTPPQEFRLPTEELDWAQETARYLKGDRPSWPSYHRYQFRSQESLTAKARLLLWTLFSPQIHDLRWINLPKQWWPFYYLLRPLRLLLQKVGLVKAEGETE